MLQRLLCWLFGHKTVIRCYSRNTGTMDSIIGVTTLLYYTLVRSPFCTRCGKKVHAD